MSRTTPPPQASIPKPDFPSQVPVKITQYQPSPQVQVQSQVVQTQSMRNGILLEAKGVNGQVELSANKITIKRKGVMARLSQGMKGDKDIFIKHITSIQFKKATNLTNGYLQFSIMGGSEVKGGLTQAASDENTVMFKKSQQHRFEQLKAMIENKIVEPSSLTM